MADAKWIVSVPSDLEQELAQSFFDGPIINDNGCRMLNEELVTYLNGLKIEIFSNEHPPPHFRVKYAEETACYAIEDCTQLNGALKKWYRNIRDWHKNNKNKLIEVWDKTRPSDCPVGKFR